MDLTIYNPTPNTVVRYSVIKPYDEQMSADDYVHATGDVYGTSSVRHTIDNNDLYIQIDDPANGFHITCNHGLLHMAAYAPGAGNVIRGVDNPEFEANIETGKPMHVNPANGRRVILSNAGPD